ncbi:hypothetical protein HDZ31DRAFT_70041, partial [Schizophyllum fasciatum]
DRGNNVSNSNVDNNIRKSNNSNSKRPNASSAFSWRAAEVSPDAPPFVPTTTYLEGEDKENGDPQAQRVHALKKLSRAAERRGSVGSDSGRPDSLDDLRHSLLMQSAPTYAQPKPAYTQSAPTCTQSEPTLSPLSAYPLLPAPAPPAKGHKARAKSVSIAPSLPSIAEYAPNDLNAPSAPNASYAPKAPNVGGKRKGRATASASSNTSPASDILYHAHPVASNMAAHPARQGRRAPAGPRPALTLAIPAQPARTAQGPALPPPPPPPPSPVAAPRDPQTALYKRLIGSNVVSFDSEGAVQHVVPASDTQRLLVRNLPADAPPAALSCVLQVLGYDPCAFFVVNVSEDEGNYTSQADRTYAHLVAQRNLAGALLASSVNCCGRRLMFEPRPAPVVPRNGRTVDVRISWQPTAFTWRLVYPSVTMAAKQRARLDGAWWHNAGGILSVRDAPEDRKHDSPSSPNGTSPSTADSSPTVVAASPADLPSSPSVDMSPPSPPGHVIHLLGVPASALPWNVAERADTLEVRRLPSSDAECEGALETLRSVLGRAGVLAEVRAGGPGEVGANARLPTFVASIRRSDLRAALNALPRAFQADGRHPAVGPLVREVRAQARMNPMASSAVATLYLAEHFGEEEALRL